MIDMKPLCAFATIALALGVASPAMTKPAKPDGLIPAGKPVTCIQTSQIRSTNVRDDRTIDFVMGGKTYRNVLPYSCPSLGFEKAFAYTTSTAQLCSVDIITVLNSAGPGLQRGASCGLGMFQPMMKSAK